MRISVKMFALTLKFMAKGHNLHMNVGKSQRCTNAAWNWNGVHTTANVKIKFEIRICKEPHLATVKLFLSVEAQVPKSN